ncbi:hypothetical protein F5Y06DRAFT_291804 [Hypoxylon sp. FL0890]|nr:hypothetical protein F5Y06DRAFT_291804 [Hypoxylon sp. FL0890]
MNLPAQIIRFLEQLELHKIFLIEWENPLLNRLGYPLVVQDDLFFLVPDDQLHTVEKLAADFGYHAADRESLRPKYPSEECNRSLRYVIPDSDKGKSRYNINPLHRVVLVPLSWTGISRDEAVLLDASAYNLPCTIYTVPVSVACTAFVRILSHEKRRGTLRMNILDSLCGVIAYHYFDMSQEGDYLEIPPDDQPWSEKEVLEMNNAVNSLKGWEMKEGEEWIRSDLIKAMTGAMSYDGLALPRII